MELHSTVRNGYETIAETYHLGRVAREAANVEWFDGLRPKMPPSGKVVDLGCGSGVPVARYFAERGYEVTGYDLSPAMLQIAQYEVPVAEFEEARMEELRLEAGSVDIVTSLFAIIHVPREEHLVLFGRIFQWLRPGGVALLGLGADDNPYEHQEDWHGAPMAWSHFGAEINLRLLSEAGFGIEWSEVEQFGGTERHLFVLARRP